MLKWFFLTPKTIKENKEQLDNIKEETVKQRLLIKEALQELAEARASGGRKR